MQCKAFAMSCGVSDGVGVGDASLRRRPKGEVPPKEAEAPPPELDAFTSGEKEGVGDACGPGVPPPVPPVLPPAAVELPITCSKVARRRPQSRRQLVQLGGCHGGAGGDTNMPSNGKGMEEGRPASAGSDPMPAGSEPMPAGSEPLLAFTLSDEGVNVGAVEPEGVVEPELGIPAPNAMTLS